jgi:hypothetical protein
MINHSQLFKIYNTVEPILGSYKNVFRDGISKFVEV